MIKNIIAHMISIYNDSFWDRIAARFHKKERNNSMLSLLFMTLWVATNPIKKTQGKVSINYQDTNQIDS